MKRFFLAFIFAFLCHIAFSQAKRPTIMVVPSDVWCSQNGYMSTFDNQGVTERVPDYMAALSSSSELQLAISTINTLMADRGFPLKDLYAVSKSIVQSNAEDELIQSKSSGASMKENPIDRFRRTARADIIMSLTWTINEVGPKKSITYSLQGLDSYTNKQVAGAQGTGANSFSCEIPVLLEEAVKSNMDNFCEQLQQYFNDIQQNGREVAVTVRIFDNSYDFDLESEFENGDETFELSEIIDMWMAAHTVNNAYNKSEASETFIKFEQVRIPLYRESDGNPQDTESFVRELRRFLKRKYGIESKVLPRGLGHCILVLGEK